MVVCIVVTRVVEKGFVDTSARPLRSEAMYDDTPVAVADGDAESERSAVRDTPQSRPPRPWISGTGRTHRTVPRILLVCRQFHSPRRHAAG